VLRGDATVVSYRSAVAVQEGSQADATDNLA